MNLKIFTLSTLFLFFIGNTNAQELTAAPSENTLDVTIVVDNTSRVSGSTRGFHLNAPDNQSVHRFSNFKLKVNLEYLSSLNNTSYFRLAYRVHSVSNGIIGPINHGVTAPVIIPPVKKKTFQFGGSIIDGYPYIIPSDFPLTGTTYKVFINLIQYETEQDQRNDTGVQTPGPSIEFIFRTASPIESTVNPVNLLTYPNPSTDHVIIELANTTANPVLVAHRPIQLTIFNKNAVKVSSHTITSSDKKNNNALYTIATAHLPKGIYFFEITHGKSKTVKTIIKK